MTKTVYLVRHGESLAQTAKRRGFDRKDWVFRDCDLSEDGERQARELKLDVEGAIVVASPLRRAVRTALLAFEEFPIIVHPAVVERGSGVPENMPRSADVLEAEFPASVDLSLLRTDGWPRKQTEEDLAQFVNWLSSRPEQKIIVVCHQNTIVKLTRAGGQVPNCMPIECTIEGDWLRKV